MCLTPEQQDGPNCCRFFDRRLAKEEMARRKAEERAKREEELQRQAEEMRKTREEEERRQEEERCQREREEAARLQKQVRSEPFLSSLQTRLLNTSAHVCVTEGGGRVPTTRGGRATQAGERETLPERGGRAHGEEKGVTLVNKGM